VSKAYPIPTEANRLESTTFTVFAIHGGGIRETKPTEDWTLRQLIEATKAGTIPGSHLNLAEMVVRVRDCNAKEERDKAKPSLPYAIPTGRFGKRGDDGWEESNGLLVLDRDGDLTKEGGEPSRSFRGLASSFGGRVAEGQRHSSTPPSSPVRRTVRKPRPTQD